MRRPRLAELTEPLASPSYRLFFAAQLISSTGSAVAPIALAFAILGIGGGGSGIALVLGAEFVIYTLLLPLAGVIADRTAGVGALVVSQMIAAVFQTGGQELPICRSCLPGRRSDLRLLPHHRRSDGPAQRLDRQ